MKRKVQILRGVKDGDWIRMKLRTLSPGTEFKVGPDGPVFTVTDRITDGAVVYALSADNSMCFFSSDASVLVQWFGV